MSRVINVVLSGGSGTRLWTLSRESKPKQFLQIFENKSLFQEMLNWDFPFADGLIPLVLMGEIPTESEDYAVFENSSKVKVVPSDFFWTDLGSFDALTDYASNNKIDELANIEGVSVLNSSALSAKKVVGINVEDLLLVDTDDTIFVMKKGSSDRVKTLCNDIKLSNPNLLK
jgi:mannose-1-phosphate guanylyltransferase